jgi:methionyl-tRNA formyltransferase
MEQAVKKTLVFLGSKPIGYQCFQEVIGKAEVLNLTVAGLLTRQRKEFGPGANLEELAREHGIPVLSGLDELPECDILYSVQYHEILKPAHIARARQAAVNLHMAPLPEYRGSNQFSFALLDGKKEFGTTIHLMAPGIDNGDILFQKRFPIPENCWVGDLYDRTFQESVKLFRYTLGHVVTGQYQPVPQKDLEPKYGTAYHNRSEMEGLKQIDLNWDADRIARTLRATMMPGFEPPYCILNGERIFFERK